MSEINGTYCNPFRFPQNYIHQNLCGSFHRTIYISLDPEVTEGEYPTGGQAIAIGCESDGKRRVINGIVTTLS